MRLDTIEFSAALQTFGYRRTLTKPDFEDQPSGRRQEVRRLLDEATYHSNTEGPAIECKPRLVLTYFRGHPFDAVGRYIGRITREEIDLSEELGLPEWLEQVAATSRSSRSPA